MEALALLMASTKRWLVGIGLALEIGCTVTSFRTLQGNYFSERGWWVGGGWWTASAYERGFAAYCTTGMHFSMSINLPWMSSRAEAMGAAGATESGGGEGGWKVMRSIFTCAQAFFDLLQGLVGAEKLVYILDCLLH